jgi:hypothetical protein
VSSSSPDSASVRIRVNTSPASVGFGGVPMNSSSAPVGCRDWFVAGIMSSSAVLGEDLALVEDQHVDLVEAAAEATLAGAEQDPRPVANSISPRPSPARSCGCAAGSSRLANMPRILPNVSRPSAAGAPSRSP